MKVSRAEALRMVRWGSDSPRDEKALPLSWLQGRLLGAADPEIQKVIEKALAKAERESLKTLPRR